MTSTNQKWPAATSCGVLLLADPGLLLLAHATGCSHWDIPKGMGDPEESPCSTALRETFEETGLRLQDDALQDLGRFRYRPDKALHLFAVRIAAQSIDLATLQCTSMFTHPKSGKVLPEVDAFAWVPFEAIGAHCAKSMKGVLSVLDLPKLLPSVPLSALRHS